MDSNDNDKQCKLLADEEDLKEETLKEEETEHPKGVLVALGAIVGAVIGFALLGPIGALLGAAVAGLGVVVAAVGKFHRKGAIVGAIIGGIVGFVFFGPVGMLVGAILGAILGGKTSFHGNDK